MMKSKVLELAKQADFVFYENESWKPPGAAIDWFCSYDDELQKFYKLVVQECAYKIADYASARIPASEYASRLREQMLGRSFVVDVEEDDEGNCFIQLPNAVVDQLGWVQETKLEWIDNKDGSYTLVRSDEEKDSL